MNESGNKPQVEVGLQTIVLTNDEVTSVCQILFFAKNVFAELSLNLLKEGKQNDSDIMNARSILSQQLSEKFRAMDEIGEPESRHIH